MFHEIEKSCVNSSGEYIDRHALYTVRKHTYLKDTSDTRVIDYERCLSDADTKGFDKTKIINPFPNGEDSDWCVTVLLSKGTKLLRYGNEDGQYTAPIGTLYEELSLPYTESSLKYNEYEVIGTCEIHKCCIAQQGYVAPGFDVKGGGFQYYHTESIRELVNKNILKRIEMNEWHNKELRK